jgi:hypothetical protein
MMPKQIAAHTDHGTVLRPDQAALVFDPDGSMSLILPSLPDDAPVPTSWRLMLAIANLCDDPEWVADVIGEASGPTA